jgi:hypothetical protein
MQIILICAAILISPFALWLAYKLDQRKSDKGGGNSG